jgi:hypothetical protein
MRCYEHNFDEGAPGGDYIMRSHDCDKLLQSGARVLSSSSTTSCCHSITAIMPAERTQRRKLNFRQQDEIQRRYTDYVAAGLRRAQEMGVSWTAAERQAAHEEAARQIQENDMYPSVMPADPSPEEAVQWCKNNLDPWVNMETESLVEYVPYPSISRSSLHCCPIISVADVHAWFQVL